MWLPYYAIPDNGCEELHNTDPFIFGDRILYSNCGQPSSPRLRSLDRGSVIAFGSRKADQWLLDTVLVVVDFVDYSPAWGRSDLAGRAPVALLDVTGGPLEDNSRDATCTPALKRRSRCGGLRASHDRDATLRLYRGATPTHPVHGMFSFFPAMPAGGGTGFPRPGVELPAPHFNKQAAAGTQAVVRPLREDTGSALGVPGGNKCTTLALSSARVRRRPRATKHELATPANPMAGLWPASVGLSLPISNTNTHIDICQFQYFLRSKTIYGGLNGVGGGT